MFKIFFEPDRKNGMRDGFFQHAAVFFALALLAMACFGGGCASLMKAPPMPKVDLAEPGWTTRQGQAVWKPTRQAPEIAGELILATRQDGSAFVQFTKNPFPFAVAQMNARGWKIEFPPQNKHYSGRGSAPARIVWFQLAKAVVGKPLAKHWAWQNSGTSWQLTNSTSGESLAGFFTQ